MAISNLLTGRVRVVSPKNVTSDRYQFLDISQAEPNLGVPNFSASLLTNPAIVVSDDQGNRGFARTISLDEISGSFSGSFQGNGSNLTNLPVAPFIASGSGTASFVEGNLNINTNTLIDGNLYVSETIFAEQLLVSYISSSIIYSSGSNKFGDASTDKQEFTGSVQIETELIAGFVTASSATGSFTGSFKGDGSQLINVPAVVAPFIASGSATASIAPDTGFVVNTFSTFQFPVSASAFSGSGEGLFNIPRSAFTGDAFRIASGSVTASIAPNTGLVVNTTITASMYSGSGRGLFDIPLNALSQEANRIASGSVTASVSPNNGFVVISQESGSQFYGNVFVNSGSYFTGSGAGLSNIPRSAITEDSNRISSGSATASISPDFGLVVTSKSGSKFDSTLFVTGGYTDVSGSGDIISISAYGSIYLYTGSYSGSGRLLRDIPLDAIKDLDLSKIGSGSVTASIRPDFGFRVNTFSEISGSLIVSASGVDIATSSLTTIFNVINVGISAWNINGQGNPALDLVRGVEYTFNVNASTHPFYLKTTSSLGSGDQYTDGVTNNGTDNGVLTFTPPTGSPDRLYYVDPDHDTMIGSIILHDVLRRPSQIKLIGDTTITGSLFVKDRIEAREISASFSGSGRNLFDIPQSALSGDSNRIASGSVTASVSPDRGFVVTSVDSGSIFSGSIFLSSGSFFSGSGEGLFNIPRTAFSGDSPRIASGSVTASVSPNFGFKVEASEVGSQFTGSVNMSQSLTVGGVISGDGSGITNINLSNISFEATRIASGSVTASVNPVDGYKINAPSTLSGSLIVSSSNYEVPLNSIETIFNVTNNAVSSYIFTGAISGNNPTLTLVRGLTYTFNVDATGHPFWIKSGSVEVSGTTNAFNNNVTNNGDDSGVVEFTPDLNTPSSLYYICQNHSGMGARINVVNALTQQAQIKIHR